MEVEVARTRGERPGSRASGPEPWRAARLARIGRARHYAPGSPEGTISLWVTVPGLGLVAHKARLSGPGCHKVRFCRGRVPQAHHPTQAHGTPVQWGAYVTKVNGPAVRSHCETAS
jgi:hypothetical protein